MKLGFTGTQVGMTIPQMSAFLALLHKLKPTEFHHGDCVGSDDEAHEMFCSWAGDGCGVTVCHPPLNPSKRAFTENTHTMVAKDYLDRNQDIVDETDRMVATPKEQFEELRSGTWATVRYARKKCKPLYVILPSGFVIGPE